MIQIFLLMMDAQKPASSRRVGPVKLKDSLVRTYVGIKCKLDLKFVMMDQMMEQDA